MNWLNDMILDIQKKVFGDRQNADVAFTTCNNGNERDSEERLHQFQTRLQDLDRRILELR